MPAAGSDVRPPSPPRSGYGVALTARTVKEGDGRGHDTATTEEDREYVLAGSLESTAHQVESEYGVRALTVPADLLDAESVTAPVDEVARVAQDRRPREQRGIRSRRPDGPLPRPAIRGPRCRTARSTPSAPADPARTPHLLGQPRSCVISTGSSAGEAAPHRSAGEGGLGRCARDDEGRGPRFGPVLHAEYFDRGLRAFTVHPGFMITGQRRASGVYEQFEEVGVVSTPVEVPGDVMAWLAVSPDSEKYCGEFVAAVGAVHPSFTGHCSVAVARRPRRDGAPRAEAPGAPPCVNLFCRTALRQSAPRDWANSISVSAIAIRPPSITSLFSTLTPFGRATRPVVSMPIASAVDQVRKRTS